MAICAMVLVRMSTNLVTANGTSYSVPRRPAASGRAADPGRPRAYGRPEILLAVQRWTSEYGDPPAMLDWEPARARRVGQEWRAARFERGVWPTARMVRTQFGRFNLAIEEAGMMPHA